MLFNFFLMIANTADRTNGLVVNASGRSQQAKTKRNRLGGYAGGLEPVEREEQQSLRQCSRSYHRRHGTPHLARGAALGNGWSKMDDCTRLAHAGFEPGSDRSLSIV